MKEAHRPSPLEALFMQRIIPPLRGSLPGRMTVAQSGGRKDVIDIDVFHAPKGRKAPLAEIRNDMLSSPAVLYLFAHHAPLGSPLKNALRENLPAIEKALHKRVTIDTAYNDAFHALTGAMHKVAEELEEFRTALASFTRVPHTSGFPKYGYSPLPTMLREFGQRLPSSVTLELYRGSILPKTAVRFRFDNLHHPKEQSCTVSLSPDLYKEIMGALKYPLSRLHGRMEDIFRKAVRMDYHPLAKA